MALLMNKVQSKHYSLLLQDDNDTTEHILSVHNDKITMLDEDNEDYDDDNDDDDDDDDDGFKSMIGEDEEQEVDVDDDDDDDIEEVGSDEEIFGGNQHRILTNDGLRHGGQCNFGRKNDYHLLANNDLEHKGSGVGFEPSINAIWTPTPMSPVRRAFFLASIMFGVLVVAMFLWALPCDVQPCDNEIKLKPRQWFTEIDYIGLNYSQLMEKINGDLTVFLSFYKVDKFFDTIPKNKSDVLEPKVNITPAGCGLLSLEEKTGNQNWKVDLEECPAHISCDTMDATGDGLLDCLVLGHGSMALMFEPIYGSIFWHIHIHNKDEGNPPPFSVSDFHYHLPIALQDLNSDGFPELLFPIVELSSTFIRDGKKSHLVLVSGRSGAVIGKPFSIANCYNILEVFKEDVSIGYTCTMENRSELTGKIPLTTLLNDIEKDLVRDRIRNESLDFDNSLKSPEANDAVCQVRYSNEGRCPYCKTRIEFGLSADSPSNLEYENARVVSWRVLSLNSACKGAVFKLWKWDANSLQKAFQEGVPPTLKIEKLSTTDAERKDAFDIKLNPTKGESYQSLYSDNDNDPAFPVDKYSYDDEYNEKKVPHETDSEPEQSLSLLTRNRRNRNPYVLDGKTKRFYEHPNSHKPKTKQISSNHDNVGGVESSSSHHGAYDGLEINNPSSSEFFNKTSLINTTLLPFSTLTAPLGYRLQKLEEVLVLLTFNGSDWVTKELGSMAVFQLCQKDCIPSYSSQKNSVLIDINSVRYDVWSIYVSSSSFSSLREDAANGTQVTWSLESYIRRLLKPV